MKKQVVTLLFTLTLGMLSGCSNMTPSEQSVLSGSALGAVGGAALGSLSGHAGEGALIGAGVGAMGGAMQDTNNRRIQAERRYAMEAYADDDSIDDGEGEYIVKEYHHYH